MNKKRVESNAESLLGRLNCFQNFWSGRTEEEQRGWAHILFQFLLFQLQTTPDEKKKDIHIDWLILLVPPSERLCFFPPMKCEKCHCECLRSFPLLPKFCRLKMDIEFDIWSFCFILIFLLFSGIIIFIFPDWIFLFSVMAIVGSERTKNVERQFLSGLPLAAHERII